MEFKRFDEDECLNYIREMLSTMANDRYEDDEILYIVDTIWDWYDKNGQTSLDALDADDNEDTFDYESLLSFVKKEVLRSEFIEMTPDDIDAIVKAELAYENSLGNFI